MFFKFSSNYLIKFFIMNIFNSTIFILLIIGGLCEREIKTIIIGI